MTKTTSLDGMSFDNLLDPVQTAPAPNPNDPPADPPADPDPDPEPEPVDTDTDPPADPEPEPEPTDTDPPATDPDPEGEDEYSMAELATELGMEVEEGFQFEEGVDGIRQVAEMFATNLAQQQIGQFAEQNPEAIRLATFMNQGGTAAEYFETFHSNARWQDVQLGDSEESTEQVARQLLSLSDQSPEDIETLISAWKEKELLKDKTEHMLGRVKEQERAQLDKAEQQLQAQREEQEQAEKAYFDEVTSLVNSGELEVFNLQPAERRKFGEWLFQVGRDGKTERNRFREQMTRAQELAVEYILFKNFEVGEIKPAAPRPAKKKLPTATNRRNPTSRGIKKQTTTTPRDQIATLDLGSLL